MVYSNERKLCLSGWLKQNHGQEYNIPMKLQKFLLFYESFSKVSGETPDFSHLMGYKIGPVFSNVWEDYIKEWDAFNYAAEQSYAKNNFPVNEVWAKKSAFVVSTLSENELSKLTHSMNLWKSKEARIMDGKHHVDLDESDFNDADRKMITLLDQMYPIEMIDNSKVFNLDNHYFVFKKSDVPKLTEQHFDTLYILSENEQLFNPIYVDIDESGRLIID